MRSVYILLTRTNTLFARAIHRITGDSYTHAALGMDRSLHKLYSFGRRYSYLMLPGGLITENIHAGVYGRNGQAPAVLCEIRVSDAVYGKIEKTIGDMMRNSRKYHYSIIGAWACYFNIPCRRSRHFFCSQFVAEVIRQSGALQLPKDPSLMMPDDFLRLPDVETVYSGALGAIRAPGVKQAVS